MRFIERCRDIWQYTICSMTLDVRDVRDTGLSFLGGRHLFPSANLTFSSQWLSQDISFFLHEISLSLEISVHRSLSLFEFLREKKFKMARKGFDLGASALQCITLTPNRPPRLC